MLLRVPPGTFLVPVFLGIFDFRKTTLRTFGLLRSGGILLGMFGRLMGGGLGMS
jgi:hypothetical protein